MEKKILAVIVTYNINKDFEKNLKNILSQVDKVFISDNSTDLKKRKKLMEIIKLDKSSKLEIKFHKKNIGLSKAQNEGLKFAIKNGYNWVLILDDDSKPEKNMVKNLLDYYSLKEKKEKIGLLAPNSFDLNSKQNFKYYVEKKEKLSIETCNKEEVKDVVTAMASGTIISIEIIKQNGFFEEEYFIDCIDTEYCLRLRKNGYKIKLIGKAILYHRLGEKKTVKFLGKVISPTNHSAFRCYNIYCNNIKLFKKYHKDNRCYFFYQFLVLSFHFFKIVAFEKDKKNKITMILNGIYRGMK